MSSNKTLFQNLREKKARGGPLTIRDGSSNRSTPPRSSSDVTPSASSPQPAVVDLSKQSEKRPMDEPLKDASAKRMKLSSMMVTPDSTSAPSNPELWTSNLAADHEGLLSLGAPGDHSYFRDLSSAAREQMSLDCGLWIYKIGSFYMSTVEKNKSLRAEVDRYRKTESDVEASKKFLADQEMHLRNMENEVVNKRGKLENALNVINDRNTMLQAYELKEKSWFEEREKLVAEVTRLKGQIKSDAGTLDDLKKENADILESAQGLVQSQFDNAIAQIKLQFPDLEIDQSKLFPTGRVEGKKIVEQADNEVYISFSPSDEVPTTLTSDPQSSNTHNLEGTHNDV